MSADPLQLTAEALEHALRLRAENPEWHGLDLRLYMTGKGCDGFTYGVSFDAREEGDVVVQVADNLAVLVDAPTAQFVNGTVIGWIVVDDESGFHVENPRHKRFRGKFFRDPQWQKKLGIEL